MCTLFASWGAHVAGGGDAVSAQRALRGATPDLIVADLRLADGALRHRRDRALRAAYGEATPALIVSGDTSDEAVAEARAAGITLLAKPVVAMALRLAAEDAIAARTADRRRCAGIGARQLSERQKKTRREAGSHRVGLRDPEREPETRARAPTSISNQLPCVAARSCIRWWNVSIRARRCCSMSLTTAFCSGENVA